jgi:glycosyltransferase involved in cell wall biosynthesis
MKQIAHIVSSLNVGGAEKFVKNIAIEQAKKGDRVIVISFGKTSDDFQSMIEQHEIKVYNLTGGIISRFIQFVGLIANLRIVHIHSPAVIRALLPIFPFLLMKKVIYTIHGEVDPPQSFLKLSPQGAGCYLHQIVAVSHSSKNSVAERYGWNVNQVNVIKNGVNIVSEKTIVNSSGVEQSSIRLGIVSRLIRLKNIPLLFEAIILLPKELMALLSIEIFGDGPEKQHLEALARKLGLNEKITFYGNVIDENTIYSSFDTLVMCSNTEGLPMSILEAMGFGLPVISTNVGAISQVISHDKTGWLYDARDLQALKKILMNVLSNADKLKIAGANAKKFIDENYAISTVAQDYNKVYEN